MSDWTDKVALITGASSGIGRATAHAFAERGAKVSLAARRESLLAELTEEIEEGGGLATCLGTASYVTGSVLTADGGHLRTM